MIELILSVFVYIIIGVILAHFSCTGDLIDKVAITIGWFPIAVGSFIFLIVDFIRRL